MKLVVMLLSLVVSLALAQPGTGAQRSVTYAIAQVNQSGVRGSVFIGEYASDLTAIVIVLRNTPAGGDHPAHFHAGNCRSNGGIVLPLSNVNGDTGLSVSLANTPYDAIVTGDHYLNIHVSAADMATIVACGEIGLNANPIAGQAPGMAATQTTPVQTQEFYTPSAESYGLFAVNNSGINGSLQISELASGSTKFTLSLYGIVQGNTYAAVLYEGDCGPDRPEVLELGAVSSTSVDPFSSLTELNVGFQDIANGNYFLYVFNGPKGSPIVACGEVGLGANR